MKYFRDTILKAALISFYIVLAGAIMIGILVLSARLPLE